MHQVVCLLSLVLSLAIPPWVDKTWLAGSAPRLFIRCKTVNLLGTNRARCRATSLIKSWRLQTRLAACRAFRLCTAIVYCCWLHDDELDVASRWLCSCSWVRWWCACDEELCVAVWWRWWVMTMLMLTVTLVLSVGRCSARSLVVSSAVWCCVTLYYCNVYVYESSSKAACQVVSFGVDHISWYVDATSATLSMSTAQFALCLSVDTTDAVTAASWL